MAKLEPAPEPDQTRCSECGVKLTAENRAEADAEYVLMDTDQVIATMPICKACDKKLEELPFVPCFSCPEFEQEVHCVPGEYTEYDAICNAGIGDLFDYTFMDGGDYDTVCPYFELLKKVEEARWEGFNNAFDVMFSVSEELRKLLAAAYREWVKNESWVPRVLDNYQLPTKDEWLQHLHEKVKHEQS